MIKIFPDPLIDNGFENVYAPSDDTYLIIDYFKFHVDNESFDGIPIQEIKIFLDLGTGTGYIALFFQIIKNQIVKFNPKVHASDIIKEAIMCARNNERLNNLGDEIEFIHSNLFHSFSESLKNSFDVIIFNPPYLPSSEIIENQKKKLQVDFSWDGGESGYEVILEFLDKVGSYMRADKVSHVYYVTSSRTDLKLFYDLVKNKGLNNQVIEKKHVFFEDLFLNRIAFE